MTKQPNENDRIKPGGQQRQEGGQGGPESDDQANVKGGQANQEAGDNRGGSR